MASKTNPFTFLQQVRSETAKVTWPSRRETMISTIMVFIMAGIAAIFFFAADWLMGLALACSSTSTYSELGGDKNGGALVYRPRIFEF